jgi:hypothetical protein
LAEIFGKAAVQDASRVSGDNRKIGNIPGDNSARTDHRPDADAVALAGNDRSRAQPCIVTDLKPPLKRE